MHPCCFVRRHLSSGAALFHGYALAVANVYSSDIFMSNVRRDAFDFGVSPTVICSWMEEVELEQFFVPVGKRKNDPLTGRTHCIHYRVLGHDEWTAIHGKDYCRYYLGKDSITKEPRWTVNPKGAPGENAISDEIKAIQAKAKETAAKRLRGTNGRFVKVISVPEHGAGVYQSMEQV